MILTRFDDLHARHARRYDLPWPRFLDLLRNVREYPGKADMPLVVYGMLGHRPTPAGCLRWEGNVIALHAVVGDVDGEAERVPMPEAVIRLDAHEIEACVVSTSTPGRYRVIAPLAQSVRPSGLAALVDRLNGLLDGALAAESWRPAQSWYVGRLAGREYCVARTRGAWLDVRNDLPGRRIAPAPVSPPRRAVPRTGPGVIEAFNAAHDLGALLTRVGLRVAGNRIIDPDREPGHRDRGSIALDGTAAVLHGPIPALGLTAGRPRRFDAFDLFCRLDCAGRFALAVRRAARLLGISPT